MKPFRLDQRLEKDCVVLGEMNGCLLLLMNNKLVPWFILVPRTCVTELFELSESENMALNKNIGLLSDFIKQQFSSTKLNVAAIGNIVSQLHIHVVGRNKADFCWPDVVWGRPEKEAYNPEDVLRISNALSRYLGEKFTISR